MSEPVDRPSLIARQRGEPVVITLNEPLTPTAVRRLQSVVQGVSGERTVIIDMTTVPGFDSQGVLDLQALQDDVGTSRLVMVGLRQAAARLFGLALVAVPEKADPTEATSIEAPIPGMVLVDIKPSSSGLDMHAAMQSAIARDIAIVIVDLRSVETASMETLTAITAASRASAVQGQELVFVNVAAEVMERLDRMDLAATTYFAVSHG